MGWRGFVRAVEADMRRSAREADRKAKMQLKQETLQDAQNTVRAFNDYIRTITSLHKLAGIALGIEVLTEVGDYL